VDRWRPPLLEIRLTLRLRREAWRVVLTLLPRPRKATREARYRVERNEARAERDALAARIEAMQLHQVEHYAAQHLAEPKDLLALSGLELAELLTEDGFADPEKIRDAASEVAAARPGLAVNSPAYDPTQGSGGSASRGTPQWSTLLK
jgi:hypothetical protein